MFPSGKKVGNKPQECEKHKRLGPQQICFHGTLYYMPTAALAHRCNIGRQLDHPLWFIEFMRAEVCRLPCITKGVHGTHRIKIPVLNCPSFPTRTLLAWALGPGTTPSLVFLTPSEFDPHLPPLKWTIKHRAAHACLPRSKPSLLGDKSPSLCTGSAKMVPTRAFFSPPTLLYFACAHSLSY